MECRLCGKQSLALFYVQGSKNQFKFYKCNQCKLVNLDLKNIQILENQNKYVEVFNPPTNYENEKDSLKTFHFITKYVTSRGKYLDIGCGSGSVLYFFKKGGWTVNGLELSPVFAEHVKSKLDIDVEVSDFMKYKGAINQYDLVSLRHVLEHIPDSIRALAKISGLLKDKGYAYFEFPNINSLSHRIQRFRNKLRLLKKKYSDTYVPGHCNEFSKYSFNYLVNSTGFRLIRWETYSNKTLTNYLYNRLHFGTKARVIIQKV